MARYGIRTEQVIIEGEIYKLSPLKGKFYADFMELASKIEDEDKELSADDYGNMVNMITESLLIEDKLAERGQVESFVSQNLPSLLEPFARVNAPKK